MKKDITRIFAIVVVAVLFVSFVATGSASSMVGYDTFNYGNTGGYGNQNKTPQYDYTPYDMGVPNLNGQVYRKETMNIYVLWVQTQLKATGLYYQEDKWDVTGSLGDHTMLEIKEFMATRGYRNHSGCVDQNVVNELATYLGSNVVPVYVGGFYSKMNSILMNPNTCQMRKIESNMIDMKVETTIGARWVQCCLQKLGYYSGAIDGKFGEGTEKAFNAFQRDYGFQERQYVTLGVARVLLAACYYNNYYLEDLP